MIAVDFFNGLQFPILRDDAVCLWIAPDVHKALVQFRPHWSQAKIITRQHRAAVVLLTMKTAMRRVGTGWSPPRRPVPRDIALKSNSAGVPVVDSSDAWLCGSGVNSLPAPTAIIDEDSRER
jgi:hypothetical protein